MQIVVNHLTRMHAASMCVAGIDLETRRHVRPVMIAGQLPCSLLARHGGPFDMGAVVDLGKTRRVLQCPEVEDHAFDPSRARAVDCFDADNFWAILVELVQPGLSDIFGAELKTIGSMSCGTEEGEGSASLGCLIPVSSPRLYVKRRPDKPDRVRMRFTDGHFDVDVGVTDIRFYGEDHATADRATVQDMAKHLDRHERVILGVGLTRPFRASPERSAMHWLQVNNIHLVGRVPWPLG